MKMQIRCEPIKKLLAIVLLAVPVFGRTVPGLYIVELKTPPAARRIAAENAMNRRVGALRQRGPVRAEQDAFRRAAGIRDNEVVSTLDLISNALIMRIGDARAAELAQRPEVLRVEPAKEIVPLMDHAVVLEQVPQAWALIGGPGNAGAGIKIGVVDNGIDSSLAAFQDATLSVPDGFPIVSTPSYVAATSNKVIVARSYEQFFNMPAPDTFTDTNGHGIAVAMCAAAVQYMGPLGPLSGIAPKAWIGAYKVFPNGVSLTSSAVVAQALEDAVADGMDVVNLSLAFDFWYPLTDQSSSAFGAAAEQASSLGLMMIWAAGNFGPERSTVSSANPSSLSVGSTDNDRLFGAPVTLDDGSSYNAIPLATNSAISGTLADVHAQDPSGQACAPLPAGSFAGRIAVTVFGDSICTPTMSLQNLKDAGAVAALLYSTPDQPELSEFHIDSAPLPGAVLSNADGQDLLSKLNANPNLNATINAVSNPLATDPNHISSFSSRGPDPNDLIRPDMSAVGQYVYAPGANGQSFIWSGTSFAAPQVAGAAAVLKAARPGLTMDQYFSLLVNTATVLSDPRGAMFPVMLQGAGRLNLAAAMTSTLVASPRTISFGAAQSIDAGHDLTIGNLGTADDTLTLSILSADSTAPSLSATSLPIAAGGTATFSVHMTAASPSAGEYQGVVRVQAASGNEIRIPYWFGVPSQVTQYIKASILNTPEAGSTDQAVILYRPTDAIGIPVLDPPSTVRVLSGSAHINSIVREIGTPALFGIHAGFGPDPGAVVFRIQSGTVQKDVLVNSVIPDTARITVNPASLDFAGILSGLTKDLSFTAGNRGGAALNVTGITSSNPSFRVTSASTFTLARGAQQVVTVRFSPTSPGAQIGTLSIQSDDPTQPALRIALTGTAAPAAGPLVLQVDGGTFANSIGFPSGASTAYFVNRLTPPKYPATLQSVQIYFGNRTNALNSGTPISVVSGTNFTGTTNINGITLTSTSGTVGKLGTFTTYTVPSLTITSGDFVVGFMVNNPANIFPADQDTTTASQGRSYVSSNGISFTVIDSVAPGNFGIRATVGFPAQ